MAIVNCKLDQTVLVRQPSRQRGLGVIEVLVALVVISFGVLGMTGLQLTGMKQSASGLSRAKALLLSENMATRMRINRDAARAQSYNSFDSRLVDCSIKPDPYCQAHQAGSAQSCNTAELAVFDMYSVACGDFGSTGTNAGVAGMLPVGAAMLVSCDDAVCTTDSSYTISVSWPESLNASNDASQADRQVQLRMRP